MLGEPPRPDSRGSTASAGTARGPSAATATSGPVLRPALDPIEWEKWLANYESGDWSRLASNDVEPEEVQAAIDDPGMDGAIKKKLKMLSDGAGGFLDSLRESDSSSCSFSITADRRIYRLLSKVRFFTSPKSIQAHAQEEVRSAAASRPDL